MFIIPNDIKESLSHLSDDELHMFCINAIREKIKKENKNLKCDIVEVYTDGASRGNPGEAGAGWIIKKGNDIIKKGKKYLGETTNNKAEYQALKCAINDALSLNFHDIIINMDSELVVKQLKGEYRVKNSDLKAIFFDVIEILSKFNWTINHIPREKNKEADSLANQAINTNK